MLLHGRAANFLNTPRNILHEVGVNKFHDRVNKFHDRKFLKEQLSWKLIAGRVRHWFYSMM